MLLSLFFFRGAFLNAIYLYDDKIIITYNYKDGTKTTTFDDINGSDYRFISMTYI